MNVNFPFVFNSNFPEITIFKIFRFHVSKILLFFLHLKDGIQKEMMYSNLRMVMSNSKSSKKSILRKLTDTSKYRHIRIFSKQSDMSLIPQDTVDTKPNSCNQSLHFTQVQLPGLKFTKLLMIAVISGWFCKVVYFIAVQYSSHYQTLPIQTYKID